MYLRQFLVCTIVFLISFNVTQLYSQESENSTEIEEKEPSIITIEHALKTTYMQDEENETDVIRFEGEVQVSVEQGNSKTTIYSDFVDFDRSRNSLYAEGSVIMEQRTNGEVTERLTADSILFDTTSLEGFFNQGRVVQEQQESLNLSDGSVLIVSSELFAKGTSNTVTFKNGNLTFCNDEDPHWEIKASRLWLLPGNEFAFANALLFIGPVPVMYFPFFYYPKDEVVFNPAFGFRSREGFFVQTSTYIIGRKPLSTTDEEDSLSGAGFNFMQQNQLKEQELQGLILRNLDENATMPTNSLKVLADYYSTLGGMIGLEGYFEPNTAFTNIGFDARLGFSNVTFLLDDFPLYVSYNDNQKYQDYGWFFGQKLPFRYGASFSTDISLSDFRFSADIPLYSDPWFNADFDDRQESMDWIDFFLSGALTAPPTIDDDGDDDSISGYTWDITASYKPTISVIEPWVSNLSVSSLNSAVVFTTQDAPSDNFENAKVQQNSPNREFFYPSQIKPLSVKMDIDGTLFEWSSNDTSLTNNEDTQIDEKTENILSMMKTPDDLLEDEIVPENEIVPDSTLLSHDTLPDVEIILQEDSLSTESSYSLRYTIDPEVSTIYTYSATKPLSTQAISPEDFDIQDPKSGQLFFKSPLNITGTLHLYSSLFSITNTLNFLPEYKNHHTLSSLYYTDDEKDDIIESDYETQQLDLKNTNTVSIKPFQSASMFKNSSLNWNTSVNIIRTDFFGTADTPEWDYATPEWDDESITQHNLNAAFEANQGDYYQRLTLTTNLPPLVDLYSGTLAFGFPIGSITGSTGYKKESSISDNWLFQPFVQSSSWTIFEKTKEGEDNKHKITLRQSYEYDIEEKISDTFSTSIAWQGLQLSYNMKNEYTYTLDETSGWVASTEKSFIPYSFSLAWNAQNFEYKNEAETISFKPGLTTALSWDMIIPTRSYFSFEPSISLEINNFLSLTFSSESRNTHLVRYVQDIIGFSQEIPGEKNIFIDLFNSFAFADEEKRKSSGFKIESFNVSIEHDLHDWTLTSEFEIEPRIVTETDGSQAFDYSPYFTLAVLWKPMSGIKTTIEDDYGEFTLNP